LRRFACLVAKRRPEPRWLSHKRIGFLVMVTFPGINGHDFSATEAEVVSEILVLAGDALSEEALADWIRQHSSTISRRSLEPTTP
jgi:hypothetical protein